MPEFVIPDLVLNTSTPPVHKHLDLYPDLLKSVGSRLVRGASYRVKDMGLGIYTGKREYHSSYILVQFIALEYPHYQGWREYSYTSGLQLLDSVNDSPVRISKGLKIIDKELMI